MIATPLKRLTRILLPDENLPLRVQIFRLVCVVIAVMCLAVVVPVNLFQNLPPEVNIGVALLGCIGAYFYWKSCRSRHHVGALLVIAVATMDLIWFWNAGSQGSLTYYFFPVVLYVMGLFRGRARWILVAGLVLNVAALFILESHFPNWVTPFQGQADRLIDHVVGIICSIAAAATIAAVILASYDREQKRIQHIASKLATSEQTYREIFNSTSDALFVYEPDGRLLDMNAHACALFGVDRQTGLAMSIADRSQGVSPYSLVEAEEKLARALAGTPQVFEWRSRRRDGTLFWSEVGLRACEVGGQLRLIGAIRDISDRKQAEEALRTHEERLRLAMAASAQGWFELNLQTGEGVASPEYLEIIGEPPASYRSSLENWMTGIHPDDRAAALHAFRDCLSSREVRTSEYRRRTQSGTWKWIRSVGKVVECNQAGKPLRLCGTHADITERKDLELRLLQSQRLEAVGTLAGGVAHDLNNILTPLLLAVRLVRDKLTEADDRELLTMIEAGGKRGAGIVKQLLAFSGSQAEQPVPLSPLELVREAAQLLRPSLAATITLVEPTAAPCGNVSADPTQLHQALMNLCVNARDAMPDGGTITLGIDRIDLPPAAAGQANAPKPGPYVVLTVTDTGHGIPPEIMGRIFDPFFTTKEVGQGTGLGLASAHGIVKAHGGFIQVESPPGQGATFKINLPALDTQPPTPTAVPPPAVAPAPTGHGECILIVDDDAIICRATGRLLEREGYRPLIAANGHQALETLRKHRQNVQLVITDFLMPEMDGATLAPLLREIVPNLRIIGVSGHNQRSRLPELQRLGFAEMLGKPYVGDELLQAVRRQLP